MTAPRKADVVVIGMGVGGERVAGSLAAAGLDVVGIEAELVGGDVPSALAVAVHAGCR